MKSLEPLKHLLADIFPRLTQLDTIKAEYRLRDDLEIDSLDMVTLQLAIEEKFDIRFDPIETNLADVFETVGSVAMFLDTYDTNLER